MAELNNNEMLEMLFKLAGFDFRKKKPGEEGGFFYYENGKRKKFDENIFVKRSYKYRLEEDIDFFPISEVSKNSDQETILFSECDMDMKEVDTITTETEDNTVIKEQTIEMNDFVTLPISDYSVSLSDDILPAA